MVQTIPVLFVASFAAALAICESLLLALIDGKVLTSKQAYSLLWDAAEAHGGDPETVALIERVAKSVYAAEPW